ncbi:hypothetical protein GUJ93_ZPchr0013g36585 [Zizania palustris]|uniref:Uncharacterized protein n=1 Tax=Zizania palustris TaxID=103762 RepID=A0A8J5WSC3_ZIZPA|nr:hypothetical protein GUJ93_ZPchr0013g36585 [Zizania palustris]
MLAIGSDPTTTCDHHLLKRPSRASNPNPKAFPPLSAESATRGSEVGFELRRRLLERGRWRPMTCERFSWPSSPETSAPSRVSEAPPSRPSVVRKCQIQRAHHRPDERQRATATQRSSRAPAN